MLPPALATDLAILRLTGAAITDLGDHMVVRSPANPGHHWGNFVVVTDPGLVDAADRWVATFGRHLPEADWVAVGLPRLPSDLAAWTALGLQPELLDTLAARTLPLQTPLPRGYTVRRLQGPDWAETVERAVARNAATGQQPAAGFARYAEAAARQRRDLSERGLAAWFGAFADGVLVADLGIVNCGRAARYQDVSTDPDHRGRGLASHLLGVAARWAAAEGCTDWVIVTEATNAAGRVYRRVGFAPAPGSAEAYRHPPGQE